MIEQAYIDTHALNEVIIKDTAHQQFFIFSQENKKIIPHNRITLSTGKPYPPYPSRNTKHTRPCAFTNEAKETYHW